MSINTVKDLTSAHNYIVVHYKLLLFKYCSYWGGLKSSVAEGFLLYTNNIKLFCKTCITTGTGPTPTYKQKQPKKRWNANTYSSSEVTDSPSEASHEPLQTQSSEEDIRYRK